MKTIHQLQNAAKRLPRLKAHAQRILAKGRRGGEELSDAQVGFFNQQIYGAEVGLRLLQLELDARHIGGAPFRDATAPEVKRRQALRSLVGVSL